MRDDIKYIALSVLLHAVAGGLFLISLGSTPPQAELLGDAAEDEAMVIIDAVSVDEAEVEAQLARLRQAEEAAREAERQRQREAEEQARREQEARERELQRQREAEEQARLEAERQRQREREEEARREAERLEQERREREEAERRRQEEEERRRQEEEERRRLEEEERRRQEEEERRRQEEEERRRQQEEEQRRLEEERQRQEEERRQAEEAERQRQIEAEMREQRARQAGQRYGAAIQRAVREAWTRPPGTPRGLTAILSIQLAPDGRVLEVSITESSGNEVFDRSAELAVRRASPLPVPDDPYSFEQFRNFNLRFIPD